MINFPKVLIVSEFFFNENSGGGLLFKNLFCNFPKEKIFIIHSDPSEKNNTIYNNYFRGNQSKFVYLLKKKIPLPIKNLIKSFINTLFSRKKKINSSLRQKIKEFQPDLIYTILGDINLMLLIKEIHQTTKKPLVIHLMDNILANYSQKSQEYKLLKYFIKSSKERLAINKKMADEYRKKFNLPFKIIHNGVSRKKIDKVKKNTKFKTILYIGSIYKKAQLESLVSISYAVKNMNLVKKKIRFLIYLPDNQKRMFERKFPKGYQIEIHKHNLNDNQYFSLISRSDILILAANFDKESINYYKLSWPAKMASYLMSKIPIFIYGPEDIFFIEEAKRKGWAFVQTEKNIQKLEKSLYQLLSDEKLRKDIINKAFKESKNFNIDKIRINFKNILIKVVK